MKGARFQGPHGLWLWEPAWLAEATVTRHQMGKRSSCMRVAFQPGFTHFSLAISTEHDSASQHVVILQFAQVGCLGLVCELGLSKFEL